MQSLSRRLFAQRVGGFFAAAMALGASAFTTGCSITLSSLLNEVSKVLLFIAPLIGGIVPIVGIVDPPLAGIVNGINTLFQAGVTALSGLFTQWADASDAAQPGILAQIEAAATSLQQNIAQLLAAAKISDPNTQATITAIVAAGNAELAELQTFIAQLKGAGGTATAALAVAKKYSYSRSQHDVKWQRAQVVGYLKRQTGHASLDIARKQLAVKLDSVSL